MLGQPRLREFSQKFLSCLNVPSAISAASSTPAISVSYVGIHVVFGAASSFEHEIKIVLMELKI